jgi:hypothetical protein
MEAKDINILDIDYVKKHNTRMYNFGLGFIQVVFSESQRAHYYTDKIPNLNDEIHNHRYNFTSKIIKGCFVQDKYKLINGDSHLLTNESCNKEREIEHNINIPVGVELIEKKTYEADQVYSIFFNEFHNVDYIGDTITFLTRGSIITDYAQVLMENGKEKVCPFSNRMNDDELYQIIESVIKS